MCSCSEVELHMYIKHVQLQRSWTAHVHSKCAVEAKLNCACTFNMCSCSEVELRIDIHWVDVILRSWTAVRHSQGAVTAQFNCVWTFKIRSIFPVATFTSHSLCAVSVNVTTTWELHSVNVPAQLNCAAHSTPECPLQLSTRAWTAQSECAPPSPRTQTSLNEFY